MESNKKVGRKMNLEEAKELYLKYNCSLFGMAREENRYEEYRNLNIPKAVEEEWRNEVFHTLKEQLKVTGTAKLFNRMCDISDCKHNKERLLDLIQALKDVRYDDLKMNAVISETILGRKALSVRSGMVFGAYDIGEPKLAKELLTFVLDLLDSQEVDSDLTARYDSDRKLCHEIAAELNINIP